jgi:hypothetical protein
MRTETGGVYDCETAAKGSFFMMCQTEGLSDKGHFCVKFTRCGIRAVPPD